MIDLQVDNLARGGLRRMLQLVHIGVLAFVIFGWGIPLPGAWLVHIIFIPAMMLHWKTNHNRCLLTVWEHRLMPAESRPDPDAVEGWFINELAHVATCGRGIPESAMKRIVDLTLAASWLLSVSRAIAYFTF